MSKLTIQLCPETGICSIIKANGNKIDLMPDEVSALREASGDADAIKKTLSEVDSSFAEELHPDEISQVSGELK